MLWMQYIPVDLHACFPSAIDSEATTVMGDGRIAGWWRDAAGTVRPFLLKSPSVADTAPEYGDALLFDHAALDPFKEPTPTRRATPCCLPTQPIEWVSQPRATGDSGPAVKRLNSS